MFPRQFTLDGPCSRIYFLSFQPSFCPLYMGTLYYRPPIQPCLKLRDHPRLLPTLCFYIFRGYKILLISLPLPSPLSTPLHHHCCPGSGLCFCSPGPVLYPLLISTFHTHLPQSVYPHLFQRDFSEIRSDLPCLRPFGDSP